MAKTGAQMARIGQNERLFVDQLHELVDYLDKLKGSGRPAKSSSADAKRERSQAQRWLDVALAGEIIGHLGIHIENGLVALGSAPATLSEVRDALQNATKLSTIKDSDGYYDYAKAVIMAEGLVDPASRAESKGEGSKLSLDWLYKEYPETMQRADARYERYGAEVAKDIEAIITGKSKVQDR